MLGPFTAGREMSKLLKFEIAIKCVLCFGAFIVAGLYGTWKRKTAAAAASIQSAGSRPLRVAIYNQVNFHTHIVAGSMHVLQAMTSAPVIVYLPRKVFEDNWYGFMDWLGKRTDIDWRLCEEFEQDCHQQFDIVWFISPEWDIGLTERVIKTLNPQMVLLYVHNGHMPQHDFNRLRALSPGLPLLTMAPHVAKHVQQRLDADPAAAGASKAEWMIPTLKYEGRYSCGLLQLQGMSSGALRFFSITGSLDKSLRNYDKMWGQIRRYREQQGRAALHKFKLNILGEVVAGFSLPDDLQEFVALYKTPTDPVFYEVVSHSHALVPALANPQYYVSKLTSSAITSLMTGVPIIADSKFLAAYSMMEPAAVFQQRPAETELDVMFRVADMPPEEMSTTRAAVAHLQRKMNARAAGLVLGWLLDSSLMPDDERSAAARLT